MQLDQLIFEGEPRLFTIAEEIAELHQEFSKQNKSVYFCQYGYSIVATHEPLESALVYTADGYFLSENAIIHKQPVYGLENIQLQCILWDIDPNHLQTDINSVHLYFDFQKLALTLFLYICQESLAQIYKHLKNRKLIKITSIQKEIAEIQFQIEYIKQILNSSCDDIVTIDSIRKVIQKLIRLLGGRVVLADNLIEIKWFFDFFVTIYFEGRVCL